MGGVAECVTKARDALIDRAVGDYVSVPDFGEEIIHALSNGSGLRVIARTSSVSFQDGSADIQQIGERLGASFILEGRRVMR